MGDYALIPYCLNSLDDIDDDGVDFTSCALEKQLTSFKSLL